jgi:23S rRNA (cytidine1920-2'-O)/16S rRNA (cytidine1409-2'-O)-methyltransferase
LSGEKQRIDTLLHEKGLFESRERARAAIMAGKVRINGNLADKPGMKVNKEASIEVSGGLPYVSRGGLKLAKALQSFHIDLNGKTVLDVGASTGGFTDCALQNGAARVYAVDVGYGQLAWKLRSDPRVVTLERTNIKNLQPGALDKRPDFITIDVSFISLGKIMPAVAALAEKNAVGIALIKPQFEAGREKVGKKGVVRDPDTHREVIGNICRMMAGNGWRVMGLDYSPVKGPEGNIEYLLHFDLSAPGHFDEQEIETAVAGAHARLGDKIDRQALL